MAATLFDQAAGLQISGKSLTSGLRLIHHEYHHQSLRVTCLASSTFLAPSHRHICMFTGVQRHLLDD